MALTKATKPRKGMLELDYETFDENNIDKTGTTDVSKKIEQLLIRLASQGKTIKQNDGVYYINSNIVMTLLDNFDLRGCTFLPGPNFKGNLRITQPQAPVVYGVGSDVVNKVNASTQISRRATSGQFDGLYDDTSLDGAYCVFKGSQGMYWSRGNIHTWVHRARVYNRGMMSNTLRYPLASGSCVEVKAIPVKSKFTTGYLPTFDMRNTPHTTNIIIEGLTRAHIMGGAVINRPLLDTGNEYMVKMVDCYDVKFHNMDDRSNLAVVGGASTSAYSVVVNNCLRCELEGITSDGIGWGSQEGESSTDTTFRKCDLSRYDFHSPFFGFTRVLECSVGNHAVMMCGTGLLYIEQTDWDIETLKLPAPEIQEIALVKTRDDYGGWFDGDLVIKNCRVNGGYTAREEAGNPIYLVAGTITMANTNPAGDILPAGSPIKPTLFNNITVDGLSFSRWLDGSRFTQILYTNLDGYLYHPKQVILRDVDYNCGGPMVFRNNSWKVTGYNGTDVTSPFYKDFTNTIELDNVSAAGFAFISDRAEHNVKVVMRNIMNRNGEPPRIQLHQRGSYELYDSQVSGFDMSYGSALLSRALGLKMVGGSVVTKEGTAPITVPTGLSHSIIFQGTDLVGDYSHTAVTDNNLELAAWVKCVGCNFYRKSDGALIPHLLLWSGTASITPTTVSLPVASGNTVWTNSIFNSIETMDTFPLPRVAGTVGRNLYNSGGVAGYGLSGVMRQNRFLIQSIYGLSSLRSLGIM